MKDRTVVMGEQAINPLEHAKAEIATLARETDMPLEFVKEIYTIEHAKLERTARIKTYAPVLLHRNVKALLREHHAST
jgi:Protein of unknown function (DUF3562)